MNKIVLGREYTTRDGREVIIDDFHGEYPYVVRGQVKVRLKSGDEWIHDDWLEDGTYLEGRMTDLDLIEVKK